MKIIYLIAATYRAAGMERILSLKAEWLAADNDVLIVTTDQKGRPSAFGLDRFRQVDLGIDYEETNGRNFVVKTVRYFFKHRRHRRLLTELLIREKADIVVCMFNNDADIVPFIKDGSRKVLEVHFSRYKKLQYERRGLWALADHIRTERDVRYASGYDRFVALTHQDMEFWKADYDRLGLKHNMTCIPNPCTLRFDAPAGLENRQVMAAGRYTHQKGFDMLIEAWKGMDTTGWTLRIAGDGDIPSDLPDNVVPGPASDIRSEYLNSSLFVLSSRYEGFGLVLAEAQAAGLPMVSFDCKCGPGEIITDGEDGFLVPEGDVAGLAERMQRLMNDSELRRRMGQAAWSNSKRFDGSVIMPQWKSLFCEIMDECPTE